jgi:outer membrane protein TolC
MHKMTAQLGCAIVLVALWCGPLAMADEPTASDAPVLTVDQAVQIALSSNRNLKIVALNVDAGNQKLLADKTHRYPAFKTYAFGSQLLVPISFVVDAGQFGTYPGIGPIPATNTSITTPSQPTAYIVASVSQPLLTLYKINLHIHGEGLSVEQAVQKLRGERQSVASDVRQAYYTVVQLENAVDATNASIEQYKELDRITQMYVEQQMALKSENLEVKAKLAQEQYKLLEQQDKLQSAKEQLNDMLARDLDTDFRTTKVPDLTPTEENLKAAQALALSQNPQVKEAEITVQEAGNARRLAKSQFVPDLGATFNYVSPFGINFVPTNIMGIGLELNWEPFDWGRRKHEVDEKTINVEQSKLNLDQTKSQILLNVNNQFRALAEARSAVTAAAANQESAREKLREITDQYKQKTALLRAVLQQQSEVEGANADYNQAMASFWTAKAKFQKAIGEE